jgi:hypothetical protein
VDLSSGAAADEAVLSIGHAEQDSAGNNRFVQDCQLVATPPYAPERCAELFCRTLSEYGIGTCTGDRYAQGWVAGAFQRHGINYVYSERDRSEIYNAAAKLFVERSVVLLNDLVLITQFRMLERRPRSGGREDEIDHGRGRGHANHDDRCNAAALLLVELAAREQRTPVCEVEIIAAASRRELPDLYTVPRIVGAVVDGERAFLAFRQGRVAHAPKLFTGTPEHLGAVISSEASGWSAQRILVADLTPGGGALRFMRQLGTDLTEVHLFGEPTGGDYLDVRAEAAFKLRDWMATAVVPEGMLSDLAAPAYTTKRGTHELLACPPGHADSLGLTLYDTSTYQHPRSISDGRQFDRALTEYELFADRDASGYNHATTQYDPLTRP